VVDNVVLGLRPDQLELSAQQFFAIFPWDGTPLDVESMQAAQFFNML
jgi:hypothetical protein